MRSRHPESEIIEFYSRTINHGTVILVVGVGFSLFGWLPSAALLLLLHIIYLDAHISLNFKVRVAKTKVDAEKSRSHTCFTTQVGYDVFHVGYAVFDVE